MQTPKETFQNRARTKIVATLGPASSSLEKLTELISVGVDVFRVNMAHGDRQSHENLVRTIRRASEDQDTPVAILVDLAGPKIRLGELSESPKTCHEGEEFLFVRGKSSPAPNALTSNYPLLVDELEVGDQVMLADGTVSMVVIEKTNDYAKARVTAHGVIKHRQGINLPGVKLSIPALGVRDKENAVWAAKAGVDMVGLSFVRTAVEVRQLTDLMRSHNSRARVVAKIEKPEALDNLEEIIEAAGGAMVARGDLGVEIDVAEIAVAQKRIITTCNRMGKPVIVATQMLDSMTHSRRPTRAEATDVANAILDGADACMLSGETAVGSFPKETVEMMNRIMLSTEKLLQGKALNRNALDLQGIHPVTGAGVFGAGIIAEELGAKLVVIHTETGGTALAKSKLRDFTPTLGVSAQIETLRQMCLFWGITPMKGAPVESIEALRQHVERWGRADGALASGDRIVIVVGNWNEEGISNQILVRELQ